MHAPLATGQEGLGESEFLLSVGIARARGGLLGLALWGVVARGPRRSGWLVLLPVDAPRGQQLARALGQVTDELTDADPAAHAEGALARLRNELQREGAPLTTHCTAVGHAHIDTAWLWPIRAL